MKIISGGQTGADRAALDAAIELGIAHGGWLTKGRKTEDGPLPARYQLEEMSSRKYRDRTRKNILESDGTLIVSYGALSGGSALTLALTIRYDRPCLHLDMEQFSREQAQQLIEEWLAQHRISCLNIAGPRASGEPRIYAAVKELITAVDWSALDQE
jgi:hypothetical protein